MSCFPRPLHALTFLFCLATANAEPPPKALNPVVVMTDIAAGQKLIDEIDTAKVAPVYQSEEGVATVAKILDREARVLAPAEKARAFAYVIGKGKKLQPGKAYILTVEYPDDIPRTIYLINRGPDHFRGWSTGTATGDVRQQYTEPAVESLNYPQTGKWQVYKQFFYLLNRFQGVVGVRNPDKPGVRPFLPEDGFHVVLFQSKKINDPRSEGVAIGKIRLYEVEKPENLYAPINYPPKELPRRRIFFREEMADNLNESADEENQAVSDPVDWYRHKMRMSKVLGINTFTKDLLEFGFNQGWETGDQDWAVEAQPPNKDLWTRLVPVATEEGLDLMPYYEYKTGIGMSKESLANQRRAHKLYHGKAEKEDQRERYTAIWWTEAHNGDLTDPETLADAKRMLDLTVVDMQGAGNFAGVWFRPRGSHLPMSFAPATIERFIKDHPGDSAVTIANQETLITSYEGDQVLYNKYVEWWFLQRKQFLVNLRDYLRDKLKQREVQVLYTPWATEPVPIPQAKGIHYTHPGVVTDDPEWWKDYADAAENDYWKWHWMPTDFDTMAEEGLYRDALEERPPINSGANWDKSEFFHGADPKNYRDVEDIAMTYPIGRLFTTTDPALLEEYHSATGLTVVRHYPLNEENGGPQAEPGPFEKLIGYISVDCDRAGTHLMLNQARAIAQGDPRNIAYLSGSSFSTGFPEIMRAFNQAFLAVPALPSTRRDGATSDPEVVVREITTPRNGTYYYVINTSMQPKGGVKVKLPAPGSVTDLVTGEKLPSNELTLNLDPAKLLAYRIDKP